MEQQLIEYENQRYYEDIDDYNEENNVIILGAVEDTTPKSKNYKNDTLPF